MEVNSPGLEGIETATDKDVAGMIFDFIEKNANQTLTVLAVKADNCLSGAYRLGSLYHSSLG